VFNVGKLKEDSAINLDSRTTSISLGLEMVSSNLLG
jgi:hypothetical protein